MGLVIALNAPKTADRSSRKDPIAWEPACRRPRRKPCRPGLNKTVDLSISQTGRNVGRLSLATILLLAPVLGLMLFALTMARGRLRASGPLARRDAYLRISVLAGTTGVMLFGLIWWAALPGGEPTDYLQGVSSIPALVLETTTAAFALSIVWIVRARLDEADHELFGKLERPIVDRRRSSGVARIPVSLLREDADEGDKTLARVLVDYVQHRSATRWVPWTIYRFAVGAAAAFAVVGFAEGPLLTRGLGDLPVVTHTDVDERGRRA